MSDVIHSTRTSAGVKVAMLATLAALACLALASPALADAGDRDLEVNAINTAPNLLHPAAAPRRVAVAIGHAKPMVRHHRY